MQAARVQQSARHVGEFAQRNASTFAVSAATSFVFALAFFLAARRAIGAMSAPLAALSLVATALALVIWNWYVRARSNGARPGAPAVHRIFAWAPLASLLLVAFACSYPGARVIDWLIWLPTIAAAWFGPPPLDFVRRRLSTKARMPATRAPVLDNDTDHVLQQLTRFRTADGHDAIRGTLTAEFAPGQRTADLYVSFCPPFERLPTAEAETEDSEIASVKLIQVLHHGAQFEVRLARAATLPQTVAVEFYAAEALAD